MAATKTVGGVHVGMYTPWGKATEVFEEARGIWRFRTDTLSCGMKLRAHENKLIPQAFRVAEGWYVETEMAIVLFIFGATTALPHIPRQSMMFVDRPEALEAQETLKNWYPERCKDAFNWDVKIVRA